MSLESSTASPNCVPRLPLSQDGHRVLWLPPHLSDLPLTPARFQIHICVISPSPLPGFNPHLCDLPLTPARFNPVSPRTVLEYFGLAGKIMFTATNFRGDRQELEGKVVYQDFSIREAILQRCERGGGANVCGGGEGYLCEALVASSSPPGFTPTCNRRSESEGRNLLHDSQGIPLITICTRMPVPLTRPSTSPTSQGTPRTSCTRQCPWHTDRSPLCK